MYICFSTFFDPYLPVNQNLKLQSVATGFVNYVSERIEKYITPDVA